MKDAKQWYDWFTNYTHEIERSEEINMPFVSWIKLHWSVMCKMLDKCDVWDGFQDDCCCYAIQ